MEIPKSIPQKREYAKSKKYDENYFKYRIMRDEWNFITQKLGNWNQHYTTLKETIKKRNFTESSKKYKDIWKRCVFCILRIPI